MTLDPQQLEQWERDGYIVLRDLFSSEETQSLLEHFMQLHANGPVEGFFSPLPLDESNGDLLRAYPRMLHPHRWDGVARRYLLDRRFEALLHELLGEKPLAAQSMFYFKPPGARGQALHQDNFYLKVAPGTCVAAWVALDAADEQNGGLFVVPGSHKLDVLCPHAADLSKSFTIEEVDVPAGMSAVPVELKAGDVLFFNGSVIHGSFSNTARNRFRRSFICHYVPASTREIADWYALLDFNGESVQRAPATGGGPCGTEDLAALRESALAQSDKIGAGLQQGAIAI